MYATDLGYIISNKFSIIILKRRNFLNFPLGFKKIVNHCAQILRNKNGIYDLYGSKIYLLYRRLFWKTILKIWIFVYL